MITSKPYEQPNNFSDPISESIDQAKKPTAQVSSDALGSLTSTVQDIRQQAAPLISRVTGQAGAVAQRGVDTILDTSQQLGEKALRLSDSSVKYVKEKPVKSMLIAAAIGAVLMALVGRGRSRRLG